MMGVAVAIVFFCFLCLLLGIGAFIADWISEERADTLPFEERS